MLLVIDGLLFCVGLYWFGTSVIKLPLWKGMSLGGGLLPAFASGVMLVLLIVNMVGIFRKEKVNKAYFAESLQKISKRELIPLAIGLLVLVGNWLIGLFLTLTVMLFCWLKFLSGYKVKTALPVTILVMAFIFAVFKVWLKLPLPSGLLGLL